MTARLHGERGMSMVEVLVAAFVLAIGILALLAVFDSSRALTSRSEREGQASIFAQQQLEQLRALPYASIALSPCTADATWTALQTTTHASYVRPTGTETAVCDTTNGRIAPSAVLQDQQLSGRGTAYRFVTWGDDPAVPGIQNFKRITVAVTAGGAGALRRPVAASTVVVDPDASSGSRRGTGGPCKVLGVICPG